MRKDRKTDVRVRNSEAAMDRRSLLRHAGVAVAAAAFPFPAGLAMAADESSASGGGAVIAKLADYISQAQSRALPDDVTEHVKLHSLDTLAAMISGSELLAGRAAIKFARAYGGEKVATVVCSKTLCGPIEAALTNAMLAHSDETDDSHAPSESHPGCSIVPAALAVGEQFGNDGTRFLRAVALGYDIGTRVTMTLGTANFEVGSHQSSHSIAGIWGSAAAAGCAAGLSAQQVRWLLDYAADQSSGLTIWQRDTDHIQKAFAFAGLGARNGVTAALVVQSGWTGVDDVLSGPYNFLLAYAPKADPAKLVDKLGERYEVTRTNIKKWTVGSPIQAPLDALQILLKRHPFEPDQVQKVVVRVANEEANLVDNREMPDISLQYMVAVMLIDKNASFQSAHDKPRMQDPAVRRQQAKVELVRDPELERLLPKRVAIVEVTLTDGTKLTERVDAVRGTAENPMPRDEVVAKARELINPILGPATSSALIEKILSLEQVKDIRDLRPLLQQA